MDLRGVGVEQDLDALALDQRFQQRRRRRVELTLHQLVHQMDQRHRAAGLGEPIGRFETEQSAADHHDALLLRRQRQQQIDVAAVAKGMHAGEIGAGHVEPQRRRAGGQHQLGERDALVAGDLEFAAADIDLGGAATVFQRDAALAPPRRRPQFDILRRGFAGQHRGQQHAIVSEPRLVADHGDGVAAERHLRQFVDQTGGGHAIADNYQRFAHGVSSYSPTRRLGRGRRLPRSCNRTACRRPRSRLRRLRGSRHRPVPFPASTAAHRRRPDNAPPWRRS